MTSELKPCPFCGGDAEIERYGCTRFSTAYHCQDCGCSLETSETFNHGREWNTRPVPDVPELVRWKHCEYPNQHKMIEHPDGEYVLHSQAAEIIAAKDKEIELLSQQCHDLNEELQGAYDRAEAAEAKLAQYEAQEPVAWLCEKLEGEDRFSKVVCNPLSVEHLAGLGGNATPLYASPAPAADLKEKCDRYERALRGIAELSATGMSFGDQVFAVTSSRAALKVEASNDKG
ncbi:Lar family restriction alleviation protein [Pseudochrobactrum saccharolyticum]|uniref:Lar family restriction alleviation protein n=1 Tax=Pseudochrobactrum saccharolyticum TaxID=354352 RepID=UPI0027587471|nr:Lar family restriction alleviation protein [Pseudochrobactrum saccharolyticum]MDP8251200.1 Lar family restriction alleviation protein [Pseudochrobactrum saccharolyticum]